MIDQSITVLISEDDMGESATREDAESYAELLELRICEAFPGAEVTVRPTRPRELPVRRQWGLSDNGWSRLLDVMRAAWDEWCSGGEAPEDGDAVECPYCGADVESRDPRTMDEADWREAADEHASSCEWVLTRAHTREARSA